MIELEKLVWKNLQPTAVFLLQRKSPIDRTIDINNWKRIVFEYEDLAKKEQLKYPVLRIDNNNSIAEVKSLIIETIKKKLICYRQYLENQIVSTRIFVCPPFL